jgi:DNA-binding NtrC family response regulator
MLRESPSIAGVGLVGLGEALASQLALAFDGYRTPIHSYSVPSDWTSFLNELRVEFVFCMAEPELYMPLLEATRRIKPELPVVVVSHSADVRGWLRALEAGAANYCAPPFEPAQIQWILGSALKPSTRLTA